MLAGPSKKESEVKRVIDVYHNLVKISEIKKPELEKCYDEYRNSSFNINKEYEWYDLSGRFDDWVNRGIFNGKLSFQQYFEMKYKEKKEGKQWKNNKKHNQELCQSAEEKAKEAEEFKERNKPSISIKYLSLYRNLRRGRGRLFKRVKKNFRMRCRVNYRRPIRFNLRTFRRRRFNRFL
jgi:hypothetical protein